MKRLLVPVLAAVAALALVGLLAYGLVSRAEDTSIDAGRRARRAARRRRAASCRVLGASGTQLARRPARQGRRAELLGVVVRRRARPRRPVLAAAQQRLQRDGTGTVLGVTYDDSTPDSLELRQEARRPLPQRPRRRHEARRGVRHDEPARRRSSSTARAGSPTSTAARSTRRAWTARCEQGAADEARRAARARSLRRARGAAPRRRARRARRRSSTSRTRSCARPATSR